MKLAHLADLHLGFRQYYRQTPAGINQREADVAKAFRAAVDGVIAAGPDLVLIAGDLFHAVRPTNYSIIFAFRQLQRIREALPDAPICVVAGNHDTPRSSEIGSILRLYEELGIYLATEEEKRWHFPQLDCSVLAVPYAATAAPERLDLRPDGNGTHQILLLHGRLEGVVPGDQYYLEYGRPLLDPELILREPWSYRALGHYHVQHEVSPNTWYCGALDYVSPNLWGELGDEAVHGDHGKGWLLVELGGKKVKVKRQPVPPARLVFDTPAIDGADLPPAEVDRRIALRLADVPEGISDAIVRVRVLDIPRHVSRELDHATLRIAKAQALHLQLDLIPPDAVSKRIGVGAPGRRQTLPELVEDFLRRRPLPERVDRDRFVALGAELLAEAEAAAEGG